VIFFSRNLHLYAKYLGIFFFDSDLNFAKQVNAVVKTSFYYLRLIAKIKSILSCRDLEPIIHSFISPRLEYWNIVYLGLSQALMNRLQLVQNAAATL